MRVLPNYRVDPDPDSGSELNAADPPGQIIVAGLRYESSNLRLLALNQNFYGFANWHPDMNQDCVTPHITTFRWRILPDAVNR
jgi:hypothetical protein